MNYEDMIDFEINKAVSAHVDFGGLIVTMNDSDETVYLCEKDGLLGMLPIDHFNPCNNPSGAWPIIVDNKINITYHSDGDACAEAFCESTNDWISVVCKNPLRSAMICFLKIKDAEQ